MVANDNLHNFTKFPLLVFGHTSLNHRPKVSIQKTLEEEISVIPHAQTLSTRFSYLGHERFSHLIYNKYLLRWRQGRRLCEAKEPADRFGSSQCTFLKPQVYQGQFLSTLLGTFMGLFLNSYIPRTKSATCCCSRVSRTLRGRHKLKTGSDGRPN